MESSELGRFEAAVLPHLDAAYTLARYLTRNAHDAKDVVQDASLRALKYADNTRRESCSRSPRRKRSVARSTAWHWNPVR